MDNIKTIKVLPLEEMFFLKKIDLEDTISSDVVCYARKVSYDYKLTPKEDPSGKHLHLGYKEEDYPSDKLDREILEHIQEKFPRAKSHTSLMMFNVEKEENAQWLSQYKKDTLKISIVYSPTSYPPLRDAAYPKEIEVLYYPTMGRKHSKLNTNICIATDKTEEYRTLSSLLDKTYNLFSSVCLGEKTIN